MLDFSLLPKIHYGHVFLTVDPEWLTPIQSLRRTVERVQNAVKFAWYSAGSVEIMHCGEADAASLREGFLRAALAEFVSVEDILNIDLEQARLAMPPLRLCDSPRPHLHLVRELRHLELHLSHDRLSVSQRDVLWGRIEQPELTRPITVDIWKLDGITVEAFLALRNARRYSAGQIHELVTWFNATQDEWGVGEIFLRAVQDYCAELAGKYFGVAA